LADVFDALTNKRPYKDPWPVDRAFEHIKTESGRHFDPRIVDAFVQAFEDILIIKERYSDQS
jgi:putative two-component system response regulator